MDTTTVLATTTAVSAAGWAFAGGVVTHLAKRLHTDSLTGIGNRDALTVLAHRAARRGRWGGAVGLLMVDIDRFKTINDTHGHPAGNVVLTTLARRLAGACRGTECPIRLHGDEFAVWLGVLPAGPTGLHTARQRAAAFHAALADPIDLYRASPNRPEHHTRLSVSASIGAATLPAAGLSVPALLAAADHALYQAKRATYRAVPALPAATAGGRPRDTRKDAA